MSEISVRDRFAMAALSAINLGQNADDLPITSQQAAEAAYDIADAMLAWRGEDNPCPPMRLIEELS